jgi:hypothetical protein
MSSREAESLAAKKGLETRALDRFALTPHNPKGLLLGFAAFDEKAIRAGTLDLADALRKTNITHLRGMGGDFRDLNVAVAPYVNARAGR